jgi:membrane protease YdiL (CAAX protease family)
MELASFDQSNDLADRARPLSELIVVVGLLEAELWFLRTQGPAWLNVGVYALILVVAWASIERRRKARPSIPTPEVGASRAWGDVLAAGLALSAVLVVAAGRVGDASETFEFAFLDKPPAKLAAWLAGKFAAALLQQLALQKFLWPTWLEITRSRSTGAILAAVTFGLIHLPSLTLVAITTLAGLVWVTLYQRSGRIAPLVLSHMILATLAHGALPERLTYDMRVGSTATADMKRFEELSDPKIRLTNRRLKDHRASLKRFASDAYYQAEGGTMPGLIRGLYRDILGRPASDGDVTFWTGRPLANPRTDLVNILLASDEYAAIVEARKAAAEERLDSTLR